MEENNTIHIKLRNFYINEHVLRAIGRLLFKPREEEIVVNGKTKIIKVEEYDGELPKYKQVVDFLSDATEDLLNKLAENEKKLDSSYQIAAQKAKERKQSQKNLQEIKELMGLTEKIFGKAGEQLDDSKSTTS